MSHVREERDRSLQPSLIEIEITEDTAVEELIPKLHVATATLPYTELRVFHPLSYRDGLFSHLSSPFLFLN